MDFTTGGVGSVTGYRQLNTRPERAAGDTQQTSQATEAYGTSETYGTQAASGSPAYSGAGTGSQSTDFSSVLAETLKEQMLETVLTQSSPQGIGSYSGYQGLSGGGIESMVLSAAAGGQVTDTQIALMMLCMMMQTGDSPEMMQLMGAMAAMLQSLEKDTVKNLRSEVMSADYSGYVLDTIDKNVFSPALGGSGSDDLPLESWKPAPLRVTSNEGNRSPERLRAVIDQFDVENAGRYEPFRNGYTYCNIFLWDVTRALGAEIPHYVNPETGEPMEYPDTKGARELGAIATEQWLLEYGEQYGWRQVDAETAQRYANEGRPAITTAGSIGHVQVVCPSQDGEFDPVRGVTISQAGRIVTNYTYLSGIYSANGQKNVKYFVHE